MFLYSLNDNNIEKTMNEKVLFYITLTDKFKCLSKYAMFEREKSSVRDGMLSC